MVSPTSSAVGVVPLVLGSAAAAGGAPSRARTQRQTEPPECPGVCSTSITCAPIGSSCPCVSGTISPSASWHCAATRATSDACACAAAPSAAISCSPGTRASAPPPNGPKIIPRNWPGGTPPVWSKW